MGSFFYYLETGIVLITMYTILVAAHELGHYLFARLFNMGVEEFAIGFGKRPLFQWMRRTYEIPMLPGEVPNVKARSSSAFDLESTGSRPAEDLVVVETPSGSVLRETTRFTVRPWPLGGFVRIKGMMPEEDGSETTIAGGFYNKPAWQRLIVLFAGPAFSILAGIMTLIPLFMISGVPKIDNRPILGVPMKDGPAFRANLKEGDVVKAIDGKPITTFYDVNRIVRDSAGKQLRFDVTRAGKPLTLVVIPELDKRKSTMFGPDMEPTPETREQAKLQAGFVYKRVDVGFREALSMAVARPVMAVAGIAELIRKPASARDNVGGPIAITAVTYDTVKQGLVSVIELAALLSISIGVLNLLPVVPLDGGQMALAAAEMLRRGKRLSLQVQSLVTAFGLAFMFVLIIGVFFVDISRFVDQSKDAKEHPAQKASK